MDAMETAQDAFLAGLQLYFLLMNWTVERSYCAAPITEASDCFLCAETLEFCTAHNPLFLARPEWLRLATCFSAYAFCLGYLIILYAAVTDSWAKLRHPILLFLGAKLYALVYYHAMEFASATPPRGLHAYFGLEGPYVLAGALVLRKVLGSGLNPLRARRSVVKYSAKPVPAAATRRALEAAIQAPNHFLSEPCNPASAPHRNHGVFTRATQVALLHRRPGDEGQAVRPQRGQAQGRRGGAGVVDRDVRVGSGWKSVTGMSSR